MAKETLREPVHIEKLAAEVRCQPAEMSMWLHGISNRGFQNGDGIPANRFDAISEGIVCREIEGDNELQRSNNEAGYAYVQRYKHGKNPLRQWIVRDPYILAATPIEAARELCARRKSENPGQNRALNAIKSREGSVCRAKTSEDVEWQEDGHEWIGRLVDPYKVAHMFSENCREDGDEEWLVGKYPIQGASHLHTLMFASSSDQSLYV